ncbi:MAG: LemA family protein [Flavobacteriales bacterium]|nr:LemA family protein [Flavobacteriales bacterium]
MKRSYVVLGVIGAVILFAFLGYYNSYNKAVKLQEGVNEKWGNVQSAYQRRADLVPNLVEIVKGAANNEKEILTKVTQARAGIVGVSDEISNAKNPEQLEMLGKKINTAINLAYEAYPQIRSTENFQGLQMQLEGTENRINRERDLYNESIKEYNTHIRGFFNRLFLSSEEFPKKEGFKAASGAEKAPDVKF